MAAKRLRDDSDRESDESGDKRMRRLPSFATVIKEAVMAKSVQNFCFVLEPIIRKVVKEEVERVLLHSARLIQRTPQMQIQVVEQSSLQLVFCNPLQLPIFTGSKIEDEDGNQLRVLLLETVNGQATPARLPSPIRVEIVVVDGDFPYEDRDDWTSAEFNNNIVRERTGRRPLIIGDVNITLRDGTAIIEDLMFTDNSSWIKGRHFRIAARVAPGTYEGPRIKEAMTRRFMVKDHRGELYRKHYPPSLGDDVWRLERIGKDGAFHKKLVAENIKTVQDFLKLSVVDPGHLRTILGVGMSDRMWEGTLGHARTCLLGDKLFLHRGSHCTILLNSICEVVEMSFDGATYTRDQLSVQQKACVQLLVRDAFHNWGQLVEVDGRFSGNTALPQNEPMPQGMIDSTSWYPGHQENTTLEFQIGGYVEVAAPINSLVGFGYDPIEDQTSPNQTFSGAIWKADHPAP